MAYTPRTDWVNDPNQEPAAEGTTPVTADDLNRWEKGIKDAHDLAEGDIDADRIATGTVSAARIPSLAQGKVSGLTAALSDRVTKETFDALVARVEALESTAE